MTKTEIANVEPKYEIALFQELDFKNLNGAIVKLGSSSKKLSEKEKEIGTNLLGEWEKNVVEKLETKERELRAVVDFINSGERNYSFDSNYYDKMKVALVEISETKKQYEEFLAAEIKLSELKLEEPVRPNIDPNKTIIENDSIFGDYERKLVDFSIKDKKLRFLLKQAHSKWISAIRANERVKAMIGGIDAYLVKLKQYKSDCKDKAHLAKINIAISDMATRKAIQEIIEFTRQIK